MGLHCTECCSECDTQNVFKLFPCAHLLCPRCMVDNLLKKSKTRFAQLRCPCCRNVTTHHEHRSEVKAHVEHDIDPMKDPFRHFSYNLSKKEQKGKMLLALIGCESNSSEEPKRSIALLDQNNGAVRETDEKALIGILSALRVAIMSGEKDVAHDNVNKVAMNPFQWKRSVFTDTRPITKYFYAFCMGGARS